MLYKRKWKETQISFEEKMNENFHNNMDDLHASKKPRCLMCASKQWSNLKLTPSLFYLWMGFHGVIWGSTFLKHDVIIHISINSLYRSLLFNLLFSSFSMNIKVYFATQQQHKQLKVMFTLAKSFSFLKIPHFSFSLMSR